MTIFQSRRNGLQKNKNSCSRSLQRIFINGEELKFGVEEAFDEIKERILDTVSVGQDNKNNTGYN